MKNIKNRDVVKAIDKFYTMLDFYTDNTYAVPKFKNFFRFFLRLEGDSRPLPSLELMAVLKEKKPTVFYYLKKDGANDKVIGILTDSPMSYEIAEKRINHYIDGF
ncbi:hypothetical protein [Alteribacillus sp. HJP-4]|uniref:hypothetical protein n=1 Tax=Alteribacillus sp. HJP-4 TaxID=2775394 RepID=UPI0035CD273B